MSKSNQRSNPHQQFYAKRLNTQSCTAELKQLTLRPSETSLHNLPINFSMRSKVDLRINEVVKRNMRVKNLKMLRAKQKQKTIQNEEQLMRGTLRSKIDQKMQLSQTNLQKMMLSKNTRSKSKQKFRQTITFRIKSMEKTSNDKAFLKSQQYTKNMEKYLSDKQSQRSISKTTSYSRINDQTKYLPQRTTKCQSFAVIQNRKKLLPRVLKVSDSQLKAKQTKKISLQKTKQIKNLCEYVQKLNLIDAKRKTKSIKIADSIKLFQKQRDKEKIIYQNRRKGLSVDEKFLKNAQKGEPRFSIINKLSFSDIYEKKLQQKLARKAFFAQMSFRQGNKIMAQQQQVKKRKRNNNILKQTLKQVQMRVNLRYMQQRKK